MVIAVYALSGFSSFLKKRKEKAPFLLQTRPVPTLLLLRPSDRSNTTKKRPHVHAIHRGVAHATQARALRK
jgi:hypothetical protein